MQIAARGLPNPRSINSATVCSSRAARAGFLRTPPSWPESMRADSPCIDAQIATAFSKAPSLLPPISAMTSTKYWKVMLHFSF
jgi:hypothetical protein